MPSHPFYMMDGRVSGCIVTLLWLLILSHPHRVFGSEIFPKVPDNVTVLEGSRLSIEWHVTPSLKHKDILWCYFRRRPNELVSWTKFVGWNPHSRRLNISTIGHVGWEFLTPEPCISGIKRQNVTPDYSGIYDLTLKDNQQREDEQVTYVTVIQDVDLEYAVFIDGKIYTGTARRTPELPGDIELKQDKSLLVNVSAPWASAITISRDDHSDIEHCEDRPCAVQLNASESGKTQSQFIIRIESTIQGAESIELKLNATVQPVHAEPASSSVMWLVIIFGVLFGLTLVIGSLLYALKFRGDPKGEKANRLRLEEEIQKLESENEDFKNAKDKLEADKEDLKTENTCLKADLTKEEEEVKKLKTDISELNQSHMGEVHVLNLQLAEKDKKILKMERDKDTMNTLRTELTEEKKKNTALAADKNRLTREKELLETTNSSLQNEVNEQDRKTTQKQKNVDKIKQLQESNKQLEGEAGRLKQEKKQLQESNKQLEGEADKLKQEVREKDGEINRLKMTLQRDASQTKADDDTTSVMSMEATPGKQIKKKKLDELVKKASDCLHKLENKHIPNWERLDLTYGTADTKFKSQALLQEIVDLRASINTKRANFSLASDGRNELNGSYKTLGYTKTDVEKLISHIEENESKPLYARRKEINPTLDTLYSYKSSLSDILSQYKEETVNDEEAFRRLTHAVKTVEDDKDKGDKFSKAESALSKQVMLKANVKEFRDKLDTYAHQAESQKFNCAPYLVEPEIGAVGDKRSAAKAGPPVRNATQV